MLEAYAAVQKSSALAKQSGEDNRLDTAAAVTSFPDDDQSLYQATSATKRHHRRPQHHNRCRPHDIPALPGSQGRGMLDEGATG